MNRSEAQRARRERELDQVVPGERAISRRSEAQRARRERESRASEFWPNFENAKSEDRQMTIYSTSTEPGDKRPEILNESYDHKGLTELGRGVTRASRTTCSDCAESFTWEAPWTPCSGHLRQVKAPKFIHAPDCRLRGDDCECWCGWDTDDVCNAERWRDGQKLISRRACRAQEHPGSSCRAGYEGINWETPAAFPNREDQDLARAA